jgi:hypothetical protein
MNDRHLIDSASYEPEVLKSIGQAFDEAWREIAGNFSSSDQIEIDEARYRLATALLSVASEDSRDVAVLKDGALQAMALDYRVRRAGDPRIAN